MSDTFKPTPPDATQFVCIRNIASTRASDFGSHNSYFSGRLLAVHDEGRVRTVVFEDGNSCRTNMTLAEIDEAVRNSKHLRYFE